MVNRNGNFTLVLVNSRNLRKNGEIRMVLDGIYFAIYVHSMYFLNIVFDEFCFWFMAEAVGYMEDEEN